MAPQTPPSPIPSSPQTPATPPPAVAEDYSKVVFETISQACKNYKTNSQRLAENITSKAKIIKKFIMIFFFVKI